MATDPKTVAYIVDQVSLAGDVVAKPMFGEYGYLLLGPNGGPGLRRPIVREADGVGSRPRTGCGGGGALSWGQAVPSGRSRALKRPGLDDLAVRRFRR